MIVNLWHESCEYTVPFENVEEVHYDYSTDEFTLIFHDGHSEVIPSINFESVKMSNIVDVEGI